MVRAVGITMANVAEASVTEARREADLFEIAVDLEHQKTQLSELHIDARLPE